ncbi:hypothetical protein MVEN_02284100 [Mycena venus]|uniref:MYND-type domain-containing protein n=1 Tax=Mycena venus TaxID=2733690 RepID=A0A8H7CFZ4_9AGAR|nr:hypothetical protein MVEN_02284100 [Mycena venus]
MDYGHNIVTAALRAGLLRAILAWGRSPLEPHFIGAFDQILNALFKSSLRTSIDELEAPIGGQTFQGFPTSDKWEALWSLLQRRWASMKAYIEREKASDRSACSNITCATIASKSVLRRCSGCRLCRYCSKACQSDDWRNGHREMCGWTGGDDGGSVSRRDMSFLHALLHDDYLRMKRNILNDELAYLRANPGAPFYVNFDYWGLAMDGACEVSVEPIDTFPLDNAMWRFQDARARSSDGRVQLHVMRIADGGCDSLFVFPLYSATAERSKGIEMLAADATSAVDGREEADSVQMQHLTEMDILEVHV